MATKHQFKPTNKIHLKTYYQHQLDSFSGSIIDKPTEESDLTPSEEDVYFLANLLTHAYDQCYYIMGSDATFAEDLEEKLAPVMGYLITKLAYYAGMTEEYKEQ